MKHGDASQYGSSDDHYTPKWVFDALGVKFDLDVASSNSGFISVPAEKRYTPEDDGLAQPWNGFVWMNPPFSKPTPWVDKFIEHGNGIALLPFTRGQWWQRLWAADCLIVPLPYNFKFDRHDQPAKPISFLTALYAMGSKGQAALIRAELGKIR
jgi:hypothetical protein